MKKCNHYTEVAKKNNFPNLHGLLVLEDVFLQNNFKTLSLLNP